MDDLLLLDIRPECLCAMTTPVDTWLQANRKQRLNPTKTQLTDLREGIRYLGVELRQNNDLPAQPLQAMPEPEKKWRFVQSLRKIERNPPIRAERPHVLAPVLTPPETKRELASVNSRMGALVHSNSFRFRQKALDKLIEQTRENPGVPSPLADDWSPFSVKKGYRAIRLR
jgi:hypothetical protein